MRYRGKNLPRISRNGRKIGLIDKGAANYENSICRSSAPCDVLRFRTADATDTIADTLAAVKEWNVRNVFCLGVKLDAHEIIHQDSCSGPANPDSYDILSVVTSYEVRQTTKGLCVLRQEF